MLLGTKYKIESDDLNVILSKKRISKETGGEYWESLRFYKNIHNAREDFIDLEINHTGLKDLDTICQKVDELKKMINKVVQ